jgi:hypothetical protein
MEEFTVHHLGSLLRCNPSFQVRPCQATPRTIARGTSPSQAPTGMPFSVGQSALPQQVVRLPRSMLSPSRDIVRGGNGARHLTLRRRCRSWALQSLRKVDKL